MAGPRGGTAQWSLLASAVVAQATISVAEMGVPALATFFKDGLDLSAAGAGLIVAAINLGRVVGSLPSGTAVDRVGEPTVMLVAGVGVGASFCAAALAPTAWAVAAALGVAGIFAGASTPAGAKLVLNAFPRAQRGLAMGVRQSAVPLGSLVAAGTLPFIADAVGWRYALAAAGGVALAGCVAVVAVPIRGAAGPPSHARADAGVTSDRAPWRDRRVARLTAWGVLLVGGQYALATYLILDLTTEGELSVGWAAAMLALASAGGVVGRIGWGVLSDRAYAGRRAPVLLVLSATGSVSAALLVAVPVWPAPPLVIPAAALAGATLIGWQGLWMSLMSELSPPTTAGRTVGYSLTFLNLSVVAWPPLLGLVADVSGTFRASWALIAVATAASGLLIVGLVEEPA